MKRLPIPEGFTTISIEKLNDAYGSARERAKAFHICDHCPYNNGRHLTGCRGEVNCAAGPNYVVVPENFGEILPVLVAFDRATRKESS